MAVIFGAPIVLSALDGGASVAKASCESGTWDFDLEAGILHERFNLRDANGNFLRSVTLPGIPIPAAMLAALRAHAQTRMENAAGQAPGSSTWG